MTTHDEDKIIAQQARIEQLTNFIKYAQVSSGVCCCGDSMEGHPSPMTCGHSPVDMWDYHSGELLEAYPDDLSALRAHDEKLRAVFQAGAASRDAEVAELVAALETVIANAPEPYCAITRAVDAQCRAALATALQRASRAAVVESRLRAAFALPVQPRCARRAAQLGPVRSCRGSRRQWR